MKAKEKDLYLVGIGASAGGLDAIQKLFDQIPENTGLSFVIIQHLSPDFKSLMPELLAKHTNMTIYTAEDKQEIQPNCIYLTHRNKNLNIKGKKLELIDPGPKHSLNLPIDIFFHSLGMEYKEKLVGIILSGTGSDGSRGIKTIKEAGGTIFVQDPVTAQFDGMPNSAIATHLTDYILSPESMAEELSKLPHMRMLLTGIMDNPDAAEVTFLAILDEIYKTSGIDFKQYKRNTLLRRIEKRLQINNMELIYDYLPFLKSNHKEKELLKQDFLIGVTSFFRDRESFEQLRFKVLPSLFNQRNEEHNLIRVWVVSCSTGEEAYSIAMLLDEYINENKLNIDFKIFATDVDTNALQIASQAKYHISNAAELEKKYLDNYFTKHGETIQVLKRIRDKIVFSNHNIIKDTTFIRIDLITCRNILIYLNNSTQLKVLTNLLFALNTNGFLFLGSSESLGECAKYFFTIDSKAKLFKNISGQKPSPIYEGHNFGMKEYQYKTNVYSEFKSELKGSDKTINSFNRFLTKKYSPSCIFFDQQFIVLFIKGDANKYLSLPEGTFESNILKMVSPQLSAVIQAGIKKLQKANDEVVIQNIQINEKGEQVLFNLNFQKTTEDDGLNNAYMIHFNDQKVIKTDIIDFENFSIDELTKTKIEVLETNLKETQSELQHVILDLETSTEELQASNEELMASNEELQSTNEELQSVNEELYTVNYEIQEKNKELTHLNNYITNLFNSTDVGTLFLDTNECIRKFTTSLQKHFNLQEGDIGRPISNFASKFNDKTRQDVLREIKNVLNDLIPKEVNVLGEEGKYFLCRINPFITIEKKIDGVVLTFVDITEIQKLNIELEIHKQKISKDSIYYKSIIDNNSFYVIKTNLQGHYTYFNNYFCQVFDVDPIKWLGRSSLDLIIPEDHALCFETVQKCLTEPGKSFRVILRKPVKKGIEHSQWDFKTLEDGKGNICEILCIGHEIASLISKQQQLQSLVDINLEQNKRLTQFTHIISHNIRSHVANLKGILQQVDRHPEQDTKPFLELIKQTIFSLDETIMNLNESITIQTNPELPMTENHLLEIIHTTENSLSNIIKESKVKISYLQQCEDDLIYANSAYLDSILLNLVTNSIKYSSKDKLPEIIIKLSENTNFKILTVADNGIGIDMQKNKDQIFGLFKTFNRNKDAKGIGLYITKIQVEAMKGKIEVESILDVGSSFTIHFPKMNPKK